MVPFTFDSFLIMLSRSQKEFFYNLLSEITHKQMT